MNSQVRIRRSRGAVSGTALILLGLWGGLAPFVGHYFHFGFTPDKAWGYTTGRLYLSAIPGAAAVLGGVAVILTRSRVVAVVGSALAALAGAWFVAGAGITQYLLKLTTISAGTPLGYTANSGPYTVREYLETLALFSGVGAVIIFAGAVGCGRASLLAARDAADAADATYYPDYEAGSAGTGQFPTVSRYPDSATDPFPEPGTGPFPTAAGHFPSAGEQYTPPSSLSPGSPPYHETPPEAPGQ